MLIRRITKHLEDQNWFAVILDMLVVIFGVYLGFQLNDWNENRKSIQKGESYLQRIAGELEQDIRFYDNVIRSNQTNIENGQFLLDTLDNKNLVSENPTRFITSLALVGSSFVVNVSNNTIEEIKFSGNLELIEDEELRNEIVDYYDFIEVSENFSHLRLEAEIEYQRRLAGILEYKYSTFGRDLSYTEAEAIPIYDIFVKKQALIDWIPTVMGSKRGTVGFSTRSRQNAKELVAKIRGEDAPEETEQLGFFN